MPKTKAFAEKGGTVEMSKIAGCAGVFLILMTAAAAGEDFPKPYSAPCVERENVFAFTEKPAVKLVAKDRYEITFALKGLCDVTVGIVDPSTGSGQAAKVVRHLASGVLGANAPDPFQKGTLKQKIYWNGKDDLGTYVKDPGKLKVRVMLGLNPMFDKRLGGTSPKNMPGLVWGIAASPEGVFVMTRGKYGRIYVRLFDSDVRYVKTLVPPPADLPEEKLGGNGCIEYEPGRRALHRFDVYNSTADQAFYLYFANRAATDCRPAYVGGRLYFTDAGETIGPVQSYLHYVYSDGATDYEGAAGRPLLNQLWAHPFPRFAASPDGKWIYIVSAGKKSAKLPVVYRISLEKKEPAAPFLGRWTVHKSGNIAPAPGNDDKSFGGPADVACDAKGRIYVADQFNSRVQVFSPEGKFLKSIPVDRPHLICVHRKTGGIYVAHTARVRGKSGGRITKFTSFDEPREEYHVHDVGAAVMELDSWAPKPRLWLGGGAQRGRGDLRTIEGIVGVTVYEEQGKTLRLIDDFDKTAAGEDGANHTGRWSGERHEFVACDPVRERVHYAGRWMGTCVFDMKTGKFVHKTINLNDNISFDKSGYMHRHFPPHAGSGWVARFDPDRPFDSRKRGEMRYPEVPYDYGVIRGRDECVGAIKSKDQPGACTFQHGIGVTMQGDVAIESNIYYAPKMEDEAAAFATSGARNSTLIGGDNGAAMRYAQFMRDIQDWEKKGESTYFIRREPGIGLTGGTVWTYEGTGELRAECAVVSGSLLNGVQMDEDGDLYLVTNNIRLFDGAAFLYGHAGVYGRKGEKRSPFTGTLIKTRGKGVRFLYKKSKVPLDKYPPRPAEVVDAKFAHNGAKGTHCWVEGAKWFYAGASPIVQDASCKCPTMRHHTDWYKRSFLPEQYRHSIGVVDSNGNLILHIGRYGNFDSASGAKSRVPVGGDNIGLSLVNYVSGTDNYLAFEDWSERLVVLKLDYHAEETVPVAP
jgi:hypothetical protein